MNHETFPAGWASGQRHKPGLFSKLLETQQKRFIILQRLLFIFFFQVLELELTNKYLLNSNNFICVAVVEADGSDCYSADTLPFHSKLFKQNPVFKY